MNPFKRLFHSYTCNVKLQNKFLISHILFVLIPIAIISLALFTRFSALLADTTIRTEESLINQMDTSVESLLEQVVTVSDTITENLFFSEIFAADDLTKYRTSEDYEIKASSFFSTINTMIDGSLVTDVKIYVSSSHEELVEDYKDTGVILTMEEAKGSYWYGIFSSGSAEELYCPGFYLSPEEKEHCGSLAYIKRFTHIVNRRETSAYVAVYFSEARLEKTLQQNSYLSDSVAYITNSRQSFVAVSNQTRAGIYFMKYEDIPSIIPTQDKFVSRTLLGEDMYMGYRSLEGTDWYLVSVVPAREVFSKQNVILMQFAIVYVLLIIVSCLMPLLITGSITRRISAVIRQMKTVRLGSQLGTPKKLPDQSDQDEIGDLIGTYNYMADELGILMEQQKQSAEELRISEYKALQAQINPHFLYNMLDMINWLSKSGKAEAVSAAVQALSKFYKLTLSKKNITTTVGEELSHVSLYVKLQNMRYEDKIDFLIDVPDELLSYEIPKLVLQPIVENSILHGIFGKESKEGTIVITAWMEHDTIVFEVSDNGVGISEQQLETILNGTGKSETGSSIGIYNTHRRLQLYYNDRKFGLSYHSTPGIGTEVTVRIPAVKYTDEE